MSLEDALSTRWYEGQVGSFGAGPSQRRGAPLSLIAFDTGSCFASFRMIRVTVQTLREKEKVRCTNQGLGLDSRADFKRTQELTPGSRTSPAQEVSTKAWSSILNHRIRRARRSVIRESE